MEVQVLILQQVVALAPTNVGVGLVVEAFH